MKTLCTFLALLGLSNLSVAAEPTHRFSWDTLLAASIKFQKDYNYDAIADSYLRVFEPAVWNHVKEDEFKLTKERKRVVEQCKREVEVFSLDQDLVLNTSLTLGKYNFDTESFPVTNMTERFHWYEDRFRVSEFSSTLRLYLTNYELLATLPMPPEQAEEFLNGRKDSRGRINRRVDVKLRIRFVGLKPRSKTDLLGDVQSATLYHNRTQKLVMREIVKPKVTGVTKPEKTTAAKNADVAKSKPEPIETQTAP